RARLAAAHVHLGHAHRGEQLLSVHLATDIFVADLLDDLTRFAAESAQFAARLGILLLVARLEGLGAALADLVLAGADRFVGFPDLPDHGDELLLATAFHRVVNETDPLHRRSLFRHHGAVAIRLGQREGHD